jgi:outer membrane immunogenic protein
MDGKAAQHKGAYEFAPPRSITSSAVASSVANTTGKVRIGISARPLSSNADLPWPNCNDRQKTALVHQRTRAISCGERVKALNYRDSDGSEGLVASGGAGLHSGALGVLVRRNLLASTALTTSTLVTGAALAANLPLKAPPAPPPAPLAWNGCYVGGNAGGAWTHIDETLTSAPPAAVASSESSGTDSSFTGGGQLGCNWQFNPNWVGGLEGDINYIHASRTGHGNILARGGEDTVRTTTLHWLATIRGRFGYAWGPSLLYATGGLALGGVNASAALTDPTNTPTTVFAGTQTETRAGWTVGAGYEYKFNDRLSWKLEYLHFDLGTLHFGVPRVAPPTSCCTPWTESAEVTGDIVRLGINYKFTQ